MKSVLQASHTAWTDIVIPLMKLDDGSVIGLTRTEMDASLRTLELMASEVGATVLVLKEIVITRLIATPGTSLYSSAVAPLSDQSPVASADWTVARPDLNHGKPRELKGRRLRRKDSWMTWMTEGRDDSGKEKQVIFGQSDLEAGETDSDDSTDRQLRSSTDEDVPPFHLDLEDAVSPLPFPPSPVLSSSTKKVSSSRWQRRPKRSSQVNDAEIAERERKAKIKRIKSATRREERRLDLLRGDGKSPACPPDFVDQATGPIPVQAHQPSRPSSLRLATPASSDGEFPHDLLLVPLDSLSLSFADVRTVSAEDASSTSTSADTVYAIPTDGEDMICVEALVVRKAGFEGEDGSWGFGGEEDGWGFGAEIDLEECEPGVEADADRTGGPTGSSNAGEISALA